MLAWSIWEAQGCLLKSFNSKHGIRRLQLSKSGMLHMSVVSNRKEFRGEQILSNVTRVERQGNI